MADVNLFMRIHSVPSRKRSGMEIGMKRKIGWKELIAIQLVVMVYTGSTIIGKFAAGASEENVGRFLLLYGAEIGVLGIYAILWQQVIRRFELSVAYANRAVALLWSLLWAVLIFGERLTFRKVLGAGLVVAGTWVVNGGKEAADGI